MGKNAITVFDDTQTYCWNEFLQNVTDEKIRVLDNYFKQTDEHGMAFLYHLMELLRRNSEKINFARYVYLLSRMEPDENKTLQRKAYREFSKKMYEWSKKPKDRRELITAIYLYVYLHRKEKEEEE